MKNRKRFIISEIAFGVLYVASYLLMYFYGAFENKSNLAGACLAVLYTMSAMISTQNDFNEKGKYRPSVRTIGLYVLGIVYLFSFAE